jgi:hypothetical protein
MKGRNNDNEKRDETEEVRKQKGTDQKKRAYVPYQTATIRFMPTVNEKLFKSAPTKWEVTACI